MVHDLASLKKRLRRFVRKRVRHRAQLVDFIDELCKIGEVALFGGVIRDLSLDTINSLASDVDIVVKSFPEFTLYDAIESFSPKKNAFGGYRLSLDKWYVDVWEFSDTWAFRQGLVEGKDFNDLIQTTFFNWDAIAYDVNRNFIICKEDYLHPLENRILDINLEDNPNVTGTVVRALRTLDKYNSKFTWRLASYVYENGMRVGNHALIEIDKNDCNRRRLKNEFLVEVFSELENFLKTPADNLFQMVDRQISFTWDD